MNPDVEKFSSLQSSSIEVSAIAGDGEVNVISAVRASNADPTGKETLFPKVRRTVRSGLTGLWAP